MDFAQPPILAGFFLGLSSTLHCFAMCGSIIGSLMAGLPQEVRQQPYAVLGYGLLYNSGRILSYGAMGGLVGFVGGTAIAALMQSEGYQAARILAALFLLAVGFSMTGWVPIFSWATRLAGPIWAQIDRVSRTLKPGRSPVQAFGFGMIWGWLPCGMVYAALTYALLAGDFVQGLLVMIAFGLGTLPALIVTAIAADKLIHFNRLPWVRPVLGLLIMVMAVLSLFEMRGGEIFFCPPPG